MLEGLNFQAQFRALEAERTPITGVTTLVPMIFRPQFHWHDQLCLTLIGNSLPSDMRGRAGYRGSSRDFGDLEGALGDVDRTITITHQAFSALRG